MYHDPDDYEGTPTAEQQEHIEAVRNCHEAAREMLAASVDVLIRRRLMVTKDELAHLNEVAVEALANEAAAATEALDSSGWNAPELDVKKLVEREHERLLDAFRVKPVNASGLLRDALRPVATNPSTRGDL